VASLLEMPATGRRRTLRLVTLRKKGMDTTENGKRPRCPAGGWKDVRRSMPHGFLDCLVRMVGGQMAVGIVGP
jgi:hypothetical protein